ncbi:hypothetical protein HK101_005214, partial [Irineochytrium annulatum]
MTATVVIPPAAAACPFLSNKNMKLDGGGKCPFSSVARESSTATAPAVTATSAEPLPSWVHTRLLRALSILHPTTPHYATSPYDTSFNWDEVSSEFAAPSARTAEFAREYARQIQGPEEELARAVTAATAASAGLWETASEGIYGRAFVDHFKNVEDGDGRDATQEVATAVAERAEEREKEGSTDIAARRRDNNLVSASRHISNDSAIALPVNDDAPASSSIDDDPHSHLPLPSTTSHHTYYIVAFRSTRHPTSSTSLLHSADALAHMEATRNGGLLRYWYGVADSQGRNLAT